VDNCTKAEKRARIAERKLAKVEKKQGATKSKLAKMESKEASSKKAAINAQAQVKKDKVQVKELKTKRETEFDRKGQEKAAKKGKKEKTAELSMIKDQGKEEQKLEQEVIKDVRKLKLQKVLDAEKIKLVKLQMEQMKQQVKKKRIDDIKRIDAEIAKERRQLDNTRRVGKAFSAYEGRNKLSINKNKKTASNVLNSISGTIMVKAKTYKKMQALQKNEAKGQALMQDELMRLQKDNAKQRSSLKKTREQEAKADAKMKKMKKDNEAAMKAQRTKLRREIEKAHQKAEAAATGSRATLFMLHRSLNKRRAGLEKDIVALRTRMKLETAGKKKLIEEYTELNMEEKHLRAQLRIIDYVQKRAKELRRKYDKDIEQVGISKQSIFYRNAKRKTLVGKFYLDIRSLQKYLHRQIGIGNEKDKQKVLRYMQDTDKRHAVVMDDIAKQSASEAHKLIDRQLATDREALAGINDPNAMLKTLEALKLKHAALKEEVKQLKKTKPTKNAVVSGIYKSVAQSINPDTVKRLDKRLDATMHSTKLAAVASKKKADKSLFKAATRIYAHQIAQARNPAYVAMKKRQYARFSGANSLSSRKQVAQMENLISDLKRPKKLVRRSMPVLSPRASRYTRSDRKKPKRATKVDASQREKPMTAAQRAIAKIKAQPKSVTKIMAEPVKPRKLGPPTKDVIKKAEKIDIKAGMKSKKVQAAIKSGNTGTAMKILMKKQRLGRRTAKVASDAKKTRARAVWHLPNGRPVHGHRGTDAARARGRGKRKARAMQPGEYADLGSDAVTELENLGKTLADLHAECDYVMKNFMIRQKGRSEEIEALQQAKQILSGADLSS